jgi:hypothetical protein
MQAEATSTQLEAGKGTKEGTPARPSFDKLWNDGKIPLTTQDQLHLDLNKRGNLVLKEGQHTAEFKAGAMQLRMRVEKELGYIVAICPRVWKSPGGKSYVPPPFAGVETSPPSSL